jgi:hypothetical protein
MYRISRNGHEPMVDVEQVEAIKPEIRSSEPGRYHADQISADPMPNGHTSRRWGIAVKRSVSSASIDWDAWPRPSPPDRGRFHATV